MVYSAAIMKKKSLADWFLRILKGMIIGMDFVLPGISGSALAVVLGLYERIIEFVAHITRNFIPNVLFFIPVGLGGLLGIYLVSHPMSFLLDNYKAPVLWFFVGTILGTVPSLWQKSGEKGRMPSHLAIMALTFVVGTVLLLAIGDKKSTEFGYDATTSVVTIHDSKVSGKISIKDKIKGSAAPLSGEIIAGEKILVRGVIFRFEKRLTKKGLLLVIFDITDYSDSVTIKFFVKHFLCLDDGDYLAFERVKRVTRTAD